MDLRVYLFANKISQREFARKLGVGSAYVHCITKGNCSIKLAKRVEELTQGEVKAIEVCPDLHTRKDRRGTYIRKKKPTPKRNSLTSLSPLPKDLEKSLTASYKKHMLDIPNDRTRNKR